ncbi:MAG: hypothetical protein ACRELY_28155 [Polyangiaceae bacterium]
MNDTHRAFQPDDIPGIAKHLKVTENEAMTLMAFAKEIAPAAA